MRFWLLILFSWCNITVAAQQGYLSNTPVKDLPIQVLLNHTDSSSSLYRLMNEITILDFFGTWCVPCIKALPHLNELKTKFNDKLSIVLISNENKTRLQKFITARSPFVFPVIADTDNTITGIFSPPAYPYTVVLDKNGIIIAITDAGSLNEKQIVGWLQEKKEISSMPLVIDSQTENPTAVQNNFKSSSKLVQLSQEFMYAAKTGDSTEGFIQSLQILPYNELRNELSSDDEKKAFWINLYNAYTQVMLKKNPEAYKKRGRFFGNKEIEIAGIRFSLEDIEHGLLRRSKTKWSLGHLNKLFPGKTEKQLRVDELDYRLHFALNCGAKSCPPIAFYKPENLNPQLEQATGAYLSGEAEYDKEKNILMLPTLMSWFRRDFGGKKKMIELVKKLNIIPADAKPKIGFKKYDWTLYLENYKT